MVYISQLCCIIFWYIFLENICSNIYIYIVIYIFICIYFVLTFTSGIDSYIYLYMYRLLRGGAFKRAMSCTAAPPGGGAINNIAQRPCHASRRTRRSGCWPGAFGSQNHNLVCQHSCHTIRTLEIDK